MAFEILGRDKVESFLQSYITDMFSEMQRKGMIKCDLVKREPDETIDIYSGAFCPKGIIHLHTNLTGLSSRIDLIYLEGHRGFDARELVIDQYKNGILHCH